jgi:ribosomal protein L7/L12
MERPISSQALEQVKAALFNGEKIAAIKFYREDTGASLKDAKEAVERLEHQWRVVSPEKFKAPRRQGGCGVAVVLVVIGLGLILLLRRWLSNFRSH